MHQRDALTKRRVKHGFALFYFHLDAHGLEPNPVNLCIRHNLGLVVFMIWGELPERRRPGRNGDRRSGPHPVVALNDKD